jgi:Icc-related predicted phosphoesterase
VKLLIVADTESRALAERFDRSRYGDVDMLLSCGDLKDGYLDYLVTMLNVPCAYVRGNHDAANNRDRLGGCIDVHGRVVRFGPLRVAGLEGSRWYGGRGVEVRDRAMEWRARLLALRIRLAGGVDVLMTHAPPLLDDAPTDHVHAGFAVLNRLVERFAPPLVLHGHIHMNYGRGPRERRIGPSRVVDCYGAHIVELDL